MDRGTLSPTEFSSVVTAITSAFGDPTRREIYLFARQSPEGVTATEVAKRFDLHPNVARHHLDKLTAGAYLDVCVARGGTGAGRPSKRYTATELGDQLDLPVRHDDVLVTLLGRALDMLPQTRTPVKRADIHIGVGVAYHDMGEFDKGLEHARLGAQLAEAANGLECACAGYYGAGRGQLATRHPDEAKVDFERSLKFANAVGFDTFMTIIRGGTAKADFERGSAGAVDDLRAAVETARALQQKYDRVHDFTADFTHTYEGGVLKKKAAERGVVKIKKPGRMRWDYTAPDKKVFVSDGRKIYSHIPADKQVSARGIEVGHIFYFGTKYSEPMKAVVSGPDGTEKPVHMGSYGIGPSRLVAAIIEAFHDDAGIKWPEAVAPFKAAILNLKQGDATTDGACESLYRELSGRGVDVLYHDLDERPGSKFATADLIGVPYQVVIDAPYTDTVNVLPGVYSRKWDFETKVNVRLLEDTRPRGTAQRGRKPQLRHR